MSRCRIAMLTKDGYKSVYCHNDGDLEFVGSMLTKYYSVPDKIGRLIDLGDLSVVGKSIGEKHSFDEHENYQHWCLAYGRDRGENRSFIKPTIHKTFHGLINYARKTEARTLYVWVNDQWYYCNVPREGKLPDWSQSQPLTPRAVLQDKASNLQEIITHHKFDNPIRQTWVRDLEEVQRQLNALRD